MDSSTRHAHALLISLLQQHPDAMRLVGVSIVTPQSGGLLPQGEFGVLHQESKWVAYDFVIFSDPHAPQRWATACVSLLANRGSNGTLVLFVNSQRMATWVQTQTIESGCTQFHPTVINIGTDPDRLLSRRNTALQLLGIWGQQQPVASHDLLRRSIQLLNVAARQSLKQGLQMADTLFLLGSKSLKINLFQTIMTMYKQPRTARFPYRSPHLRNMLHLMRDQSFRSAQIALARKWIFHIIRDRHLRLSRSLRLAIEHSEDIDALEALFWSLLPPQQKAELYSALRRFRWGPH